MLNPVMPNSLGGEDVLRHFEGLHIGECQDADQKCVRSPSVTSLSSSSGMTSSVDSMKTVESTSISNRVPTPVSPYGQAIIPSKQKGPSGHSVGSWNSGIGNLEPELDTWDSRYRGNCPTSVHANEIEPCQSEAPLSREQQDLILEKPCVGLREHMNDADGSRSTPNRKPARGNPKGRNVSSQSPTSRRKGTQQPNENENENDNDDDENDATQQGSTEAGHDFDQSKYLGCPFPAHYPQRYVNVYNSCTERPGFPSPGKLVEHLKRVHSRFSVCLKCKRRFTGKTKKDASRVHDEHVKGGTCSPKELTLSDPELMDEHQETLFSTSIIQGHGMDAEEKWWKIYCFLFRDHGTLIPSPHYNYLVPFHTIFEFFRTQHRPPLHDTPRSSPNMVRSRSESRFDPLTAQLMKSSSITNGLHHSFPPYHTHIYDNTLPLGNVEDTDLSIPAFPHPEQQTLNHQLDVFPSASTINKEDGQGWAVAQPIDSGYADNDTEAAANKDCPFPPNAAAMDVSDSGTGQFVEFSNTIPEAYRGGNVDDSTALSGSWMLGWGSLTPGLGNS